jgi:diguanylate cyclase (GGDEF)-like protein
VNLKDMRKHFSVFVIATSENVAALALSSNSYEQSKQFTSPEAAIVAASASLPHVVLFDYARFPMEWQTTVARLKALSPEILIILMLPPSKKNATWALAQVESGTAYSFIGYPTLNDAGGEVALRKEVLQCVDRACERLYYQFEGEQLSEQFTSWSELAESTERFVQAVDADQCVQIFMETMSRMHSNVPIIYLRYVPSHLSFAVSRACGWSMEKLNGLGLELKSVDAARLFEIFRYPEAMPGLDDFVKQVFNVERFSIFIHRSDSEVQGAFIVLSEIDILSPGSAFRVLKTIFEITFRRETALREKQALSILDSVSGVYNRKHFNQKLDEEISRARRLLLPVSLLKININNASFQKMNQELGPQQFGAVIKMLAAILKRTTRVNDIVARTEANEMSIILPHTGYEGAAIKAERIRHLIETTKFPILEMRGLGPLFVNFGVSEYPTFASDAEGVVRTSEEAVRFIVDDQAKEKRGKPNLKRVCIAAAPMGFTMEFVPLTAAAWKDRHHE